VRLKSPDAREDNADEAAYVIKSADWMTVREN
jgi:hypothetical protein